MAETTEPVIDIVGQLLTLPIRTVDPVVKIISIEIEPVKIEIKESVKAPVYPLMEPTLLSHAPKPLKVFTITEPAAITEKSAKNPKPQLKKAKNINYKPNFERLTQTDITDLKAFNPDIFKNLTYIQISFLKAMAVKEGVDDWISHIDSEISYEENKENIISLFGHTDTDKELLIKANKYDAVAVEYYGSVTESL